MTAGEIERHIICGYTAGSHGYREAAASLLDTGLADILSQLGNAIDISVAAQAAGTYDATHITNVREMIQKHPLRQADVRGSWIGTLVDEPTGWSFVVHARETRPGRWGASSSSSKSDYQELNDSLDPYLGGGPPPTTTDQRVAAVGLTAKLTAYRPYERAQPRSHADFLETLTSADAPEWIRADGGLRSFKP